MKNKALFQMIGKIILPILLLSWLFGNLLDMTYAKNLGKEPDVVITVDRNGNTLQEGNLFGSELWVPGSERSGVIRINNRFKRFEVSNLGVSVELLKIKEAYDKNTVYDSFLRNMKLSIERGKILELWASDKIVDNKALAALLHEPGDKNKQGYILKDSERFYIEKNDFVDLKYTLLMEYENSGNELQGLKANVSLFVNVNEKTSDLPPVDPSKEEDGGKNKSSGGGGGSKKGDKSIHKTGDEIPDVAGHWAHDCIETLLNHGVISGYPDGSIRPDNPITRAETAVLVANALKLLPSMQSNSIYRDALPLWAQRYIQVTTSQKIFVGYPDKTFKASRTITREEMTVVLIKGFERRLQEDIAIMFLDRDAIGKWAEEYVKIAVQHKIIVGYPDHTFKPKNNITRAEAFTIICKLMGLHPEHL